MKVQLEAKKALELARGCQTGVHWDCLKPARPLVPGQDNVLVRSALYLKAFGKKPEITSLWIGPFLVLEGPDDHNNY
jgi:hypothetical protein